MEIDFKSYRTWEIIGTIVAVIILVLCIFPPSCSNSSSSNDYYEQSTGNSIWDGTWKFGDSWTIKLNSKTDEAIVNGDSCYWQDGGNYAVIAAPGRSVIYMRKDGHLYTGDNKGNITVDFGFCLKKQ